VGHVLGDYGAGYSCCEITDCLEGVEVKSGNLEGVKKHWTTVAKVRPGTVFWTRDHGFVMKRLDGRFCDYDGNNELFGIAGYTPCMVGDKALIL
jgi:hypothetical protein